MKILKAMLAGIGLMAAGTIWAGGAAASYLKAAGPAAPATRTLGYGDAVVLGLVEGITEFLPVSSTGHLIIATHLLGLDGTQPLVDRAGKVIMTQRGGKSEAVTLNDAVDAYDVIIQGGAIAAVLILYWRRLWMMVAGLRGQDPAGLRLLRNLVVAFLPAAVIGLLLEKWIDAHLFQVWAVLSATVAGAFLMLGVEGWRKKHAARLEATPGPDLPDLPWTQALVIGFCQVLSMWPGTSRSMMTIVGGYWVGLRPVRAAEFSFLLGFVTLTAASGYKAMKHGSELVRGLDIGPLVVGVVVATVSAALAVKWFVGWLTKHGLAAFAWYRLAAAVVVALWLWG